MANIFFKLEKMDVADSLYRQVTSMWYSHLKNQVAKKTEISELESILGKKGDDETEKEFEAKTKTYKMYKGIYRRSDALIVDVR